MSPTPKKSNAFLGRAKKNWSGSGACMKRRLKTAPVRNLAHGRDDAAADHDAGAMNAFVLEIIKKAQAEELQDESLEEGQEAAEEGGGEEEEGEEEGEEEEGVEEEEGEEEEEDGEEEEEDGEEEEEEEQTSEEAFEELQEVLNAQDEALRMLEMLNNQTAGNEFYDDIFKCYVVNQSADPHGSTVSEMASLVDMWDEQMKKLDKREGKLFDRLCGEGYDIRDFYDSHLIHPKVRCLEVDPASIRLKKKVDAILEKTNPVQDISHTGAVSTIVAGGASGYKGIDDTHMPEDAEVDVLDADAEIGLNDKAPDKANIFDEDDDADGKEEPSKIVDTGAEWFRGCRISGDLLSTLAEHQIRCLKFALGQLLDESGVLVAHSMGLGKTLTVLSTLETYLTRFPGTRVVVACPKAMVMPWIGQVDKWEDVITLDSYPITDKDQTIPHLTKSWRKHGGILVVGHDQYKRIYQDLNIDEDCILVVDEAHLLKSPTTGLYQAISNTRTSRRVFMTGTPLQNNLREYYFIMELLAQGLLGDTVSDFNRDFEQLINYSSDATDEEVDVSNQTIQVLRHMVSSVMDEESDASLRQHLSTKQDFCIFHPCSGSTQVSAQNIVADRHVVHEAARDDKIEVASAIINAIHANASSDCIVVFSTRIDSLKAMQKIFPGDIYQGSTSIQERDRIVNDFETSPGKTILYVSTSAGGVGISLVRANRVILFDLHWNPVFDEQAVARCFRMGQVKSVYCYRLVAADTIEQHIYAMNLRKRTMATRVLDDNDAARVYTKEALQEAESIELMGEIDKTDLLATDTCLFAAVVSSPYVEVRVHESNQTGDVEMNEAVQNAIANRVAKYKMDKVKHSVTIDDETLLVSASDLFLTLKDGSKVLAPPPKPVILKTSHDGHECCVEFDDDEDVIGQVSSVKPSDHIFVTCPETKNLAIQVYRRRLDHEQDEDDFWMVDPTLYLLYHCSEGDVYTSDAPINPNFGWFEPGTWLIKTCLVNTVTNEMSLPSEASAPITVN